MNKKKKDNIIKKQINMKTYHRKGNKIILIHKVWFGL